MAAIPKRESTSTVAAIYRHHEARNASEEPRGYLGWSGIGEPCDRRLWYGFRWAGREAFEGRLLRLFDTGHREEARVLDELRAIGCEVFDRDEWGHQFEVTSVGGHLVGHCDAVVLGLPEAPKTPHLVDVKTIKAKKFEELLKKGMKALYPKYWAQGHGYMGRLSLDRAMFIFVCKDDDRIHVERFEFDPVEFARLEARAERIVASATPPARLSEDPAWFECKFCEHQALCHGQAVPDVNCRTCAHATPRLDVEGGIWQCEHEHVALDNATQRQGCNGHRFIPVLLERVAVQFDAREEPDGNLAVDYRLQDGTTFCNGYPPAYGSREIKACSDTAILGDEQLKAIKAAVPQSRVVA